MARLALEKLRQSLKGALPRPAYYIHGVEGVLKDEALALILSSGLDAATRDFNLDSFSAQQLDPAELPAACATLPMMAERRVVVVRDIEAWKRKSKAKTPAVQYLERPMPETVLVMVQTNDDDPDEELASRATSIECVAPVGDRLEAWLDDRLAAEGVVLTPPARDHLIRATGGDLGLLTAESQKLAGLSTGEPIDAEAVGALVGVRFGETGEDWRDAVVRDDTDQALGLVPRLLETTGNSAVRLVSLLGTSLVALQWTRATAAGRRIRDDALARAIKQDLFFKLRPNIGNYELAAKLFARVVGRWPAPRLRSAVAATLEADVALKGTTISNAGGVLTDLVIALAATRAQRAA